MYLLLKDNELSIILLNVYICMINEITTTLYCYNIYKYTTFCTLFLDGLF